MRRRKRIARKVFKTAGFTVFVGTMYAAIIVGLVQYHFGGNNVHKKEK